MEFIDLKTQYRELETEIRRRIDAVLAHGQYIMGPEVHELEERLADYVGVKHCIATASGTDSLLIALMALGVGHGDEIITTPFSFFATAEVIVLLGARPVFVDIDPLTYNIDPAQIEAAITPNTRGIMPVSIYGQCADFDSINAIAKKHGLPVIEDGAQSFGATYRGRRSCGLSTIGATSFFPSKPLGCYGDGGALFTGDDSLAKVMQEIRSHGQEQRYRHVRIGINGRMDTIQAAILLAKLGRFDREIAWRREIGARYTQLLATHNEAGVPDMARIDTPYIEPHNTSVYAQYTIQTSNRDGLSAHLKSVGIPTAIHYPTPLHHQPALDRREIQYPNTEAASGRVLSLPMSADLAKQDQVNIVQAIRQW